MLGGVQTLWRANVPQLYVDVDREKAKALGVPLDELYGTLAATLGTYYVNDFNKYGRTWQVLMSAEPGYRKRPDDVGASTCAPRRARWCRSPRSRASSYSRRPGFARPLQQPAGGEDLRPGRAGRLLGPGDRARVESIARKTLPPDFSFDWGGASFQEKRSGGTSSSRSASRRSWCS